MIRTYIYGVPHGFDFYEKDANLNNYFKGFYISSRRGRRLMVNRQENGETIYSYLQYGLKEVERQPLHSFFGMSLVVDDYQYCPNFKVLLEWFDYLFNKLVKEQRIIKKNEDGVLCYVIHKFEEVSDEVNWLKNIIPNIITKSEQADDVKVEISKYDKSFFVGNVGQIVCFNKPVSEKRLFEVFHKNSWISVSSEILEKEEVNTSGNIADSEVIEYSYEELDEECNKFTGTLLSIAIDISCTSVTDLAKIEEKVQKTCINLENYLPTIDNIEEKNKFKNLESKYNSLKDKILTLQSKSTGTISTSTSPQGKNLYCFSCKKYKPLSHFRSIELTKCKECEEKDHIEPADNEGYKVCKHCGKKKALKAFCNSETDICDDCSNIKQQKSENSALQRLKENIPLTKGFVRISMGLLVVVATIMIIFFSRMKNDNEVHGIARIDSTQIVKNSSNVDIKEVNRFIKSYNFKELFEYIREKQDADKYKSLIKHSVNGYLWKIIDTSTSAQEDIERFYIENNELLEFIGFDKDDKDTWRETITDYNQMLSIIKKDKVTEKDVEVGKEILKKHSNLFPSDWEARLKNIPKEETKKEEKKVNVITENKMAYTLCYTKVNGKPTSITIKTGTTYGYEGLLGSNVIVTTSNGKIRQNGKSRCVVSLSEARAYTITLDNKTVVTITAKTGVKDKFNE